MEKLAQVIQELGNQYLIYKYVDEGITVVVLSICLFGAYKLVRRMLEE